jgi:hypothetical protein
MRDLSISPATIVGAPHLDTPAARTSLAAQAGFFLRHTSPLLLALNALALVVARATIGGFTWLDAPVLVVTVAWWPFQEWLFHKVLLHRRPTRLFGRTLDPGFARAHRAHHRQPWIVDKTLLPVPLLLVLIALQPVSWLLWPSWHLGLTAGAAYACCALAYEWTHYLCHSHYVPRGTYYRRIWKNHRLHHFKNEHHWYSFTVPMVDAWLGTDPDAASVATSETVRTLGVDDET